MHPCEKRSMLAKAIHRIRQFYNAMFSVYTKADECFATGYLGSEEISLFNQLPAFEKKHAVNVARRMLEMALYNPELDPRKLVRLGLLHDIGKVAEHNTILSKSLLVLFRYFTPGLYQALAERGVGDRRFRRYYNHRHHGQVGAQMLARIGVSSEILSIVKKHDPRVEPFAPEDPVELKILQQADSY